MHNQQSTIINVMSGLTFLPFRSNSVRVSELIPPYVQTDLGPNHGMDSRAMPLPDFINEVVKLMENGPEADEIVVDRCKPLRFASESGSIDQTFKSLNEAVG